MLEVQHFRCFIFTHLPVRILITNTPMSPRSSQSTDPIHTQTPTPPLTSTTRKNAKHATNTTTPGTTPIPPTPYTHPTTRSIQDPLPPLLSVLQTSQNKNTPTAACNMTTSPPLYHTLPHLAPFRPASRCEPKLPELFLACLVYTNQLLYRYPTKNGLAKLCRILFQTSCMYLPTYPTPFPFNPNCFLWWSLR